MRTLHGMVLATESTVTVADWITAGAAAGSFFVAFLLWRVTRRYTAETKAIAQANDRMADANDQLVRSNQQVIEEMRKEQRHARHERSAGAAQRMTAATTVLMLEWRAAVDDPSNIQYPLTDERPYGQPLSADEKRRGAFTVWQTTYATERADIDSEVLVEELDRFSRIVSTALTDWDAIQLADDDGDPSHAPRRRSDYRSHRLGWAHRRLVNSLDAHRRGEPLPAPEQPLNAGAFLELPPGTSDADLDAKYPRR